jgi:hypothetical protein
MEAAVTALPPGNGASKASTVSMRMTVLVGRLILEGLVELS